MPRLNKHTQFGVAYTDDQADGAWPNTTRVVKSVFEPGDAHAIGDCGTIVGSLHLDLEFFYFVVWDSHPGWPVGVLGRKVRRTG